jgi:hypothetical protein
LDGLHEGYKMRKRFLRVFARLLFACAISLYGFSADACSRLSPISREQMFFEADAIVRATAVRYFLAPKPNSYPLPMPDSTIEFKVAEVLSGKDIPRTLVINGYLSDKDDFNDHPVPYEFVRPLGRAGMCYASEYKKGAEFLLFLRKEASGWAPYWNALAPTNEQLRSVRDPWLIWARDYIRSSETHPSPERELRKLTRMWDEAIMNRNTEMLGRLLSDDYSISFYSKAMYIEAVTAPEVKFTLARKHNVTVRIYDGTAVITGSDTLTSEGGASGHRSNTFDFMDVWIRQRGQWRCIASMADQ